MSIQEPFVITIVGAESSGKTTLAMRLGDYFECPVVPEYAREYLASLGRQYNEVDLQHIATGQWQRIQHAIQNLPSHRKDVNENDKEDAQLNELIAQINSSFTDSGKKNLILVD